MTVGHSRNIPFQQIPSIPKMQYPMNGFQESICFAGKNLQQLCDQQKVIIVQKTLGCQHNIKTQQLTIRAAC